MIRLTATPGSIANHFVRQGLNPGEKAVREHAIPVCVDTSRHQPALVHDAAERQVNRGGMNLESHGFHGY
jgi:hypothetical protein